MIQTQPEYPILYFNVLFNNIYFQSPSRASHLFGGQEAVHPTLPLLSPKPSVSEMFSGLRELVHRTTSDTDHEPLVGTHAGQREMSDTHVVQFFFRVF